MGNIAIVAVRLDALGEIEEHPEEFVKNMSACIQNPGNRRLDVRAGRHANAADVMPYRHTSDKVLYLLAGGTVVKVDEETTKPGHWAHDYIKRLFEQYGPGLEVTSKET